MKLYELITKISVQRNSIFYCGYVDLSYSKSIDNYDFIKLIIERRNI